jgi:hypothetical protein
VVEIRHQDQVLLACEEVVHRRELPRDADRGAHPVGIAGRIMAGDTHFATIGGHERGKNVHHGGLAGAVGAEQREDHPLRNVQIYALEYNLLPERLAQPGRRDRRWGCGNAPSFRSGALVSLAFHRAPFFRIAVLYFILLSANINLFKIS